MRYGSVCSGIEAASVAWHSLGWEAQWFSEIEHFPSEVLKYRFPNVPNLGDMTQLNQFQQFNEQPIDLLVGGTPCQSFSVAGLRKGLADPRGNLMLTFLSIADAKKPKWILWENVPGVLSSNGGKDFGTFLGALGELGYGFAYRVLDAQHFGVAQRRRRVFVVGYLGDWRPAAAVLFESESLQRDSKPSRAKRKETPTDAQGSVGGSSKSWWDGGQTAATLTKQNAGGNQRMPDKDNFGAVIEQVAQPIPIHDQATRFQGKRGDKQDGKGNGLGIGNEGDVMNTLTKADKHAVAQPIAAHKVSPTITAKMQGMSGWAPYNETEHLVPVAQPIALDTYNYTTNERITQTIRSQKSDTEHIGAVMQPISLDCYNQSVTGDKVGIIREQHGTNMNAIAVDCFNQTINENTTQTIGSSASDVNHYGAVLEQKSVGALCARDFKGVGSQYVDEGKVIASPVTMAIRRLTPKECERLQGFPDDWTKIPYRNKPADQCPDGPRYKACGNSMAVPVMRWIGERIQMIENYLNPNL